MKENFLNNLIFVLFIFLLLFFSLLSFLISFQVVPQEIISQEVEQVLHLFYKSFTSQLLLSLIGILLLIIALYLIWLKQKTIQQVPSVKINTDDGDIKISTFSLKQIILNILQNKIQDVKEIYPEIQVIKNGGIKTLLKLVVMPNCNIPQTAQSIQEKLKTELPRISGVEVKEIKINVDKLYYDEHQENSK